MILVGDTSGLVVAFNSADPRSAAARDALRVAALTVVSPLVLLELEHVITRNINRRAADDVVDWVMEQQRSGRVELATVSAELCRRARLVQRKYADLRLDLTDAVNVVLAAEYETEDVLTLDHRDFRAIAPLTPGKAFRLLPADV
jgi:uncharacterized protein